MRMINCKNCKSDCAEKGIAHEKYSCLGYRGNTNADRILAFLHRKMMAAVVHGWKSCIDWLKQKR